MSTDNYTIYLIITACFLSYFGLSLILVGIPERLRDTVYRSARRFMGAAYLVLALSIITFLTLRFRELPVSYRMALNLSCYFIAAKLFAASFITLIGKRVNLRDMVPKWHFASACAYPICVWTMLFINDAEVSRALQILAAVILLIWIVFDIRYFFIAYNKVVEIGELYYSEGIRVHVNWMINSVYFMVLIGVFSAMIAINTHIISRWILLIYLLSFLAVCVYIFNQFMQFAVMYSNLIAQSESTELVPDVEIESIQLSPRVLQHLNKQIAIWIASKEYCQKGITIATASTQMLSNRLYLSNYINVTYKCSFKVWVSHLRVTEAKRILSTYRGVTITSVAEQVGFLSLTSFTHAFKRLEGISPKEWVRNNS